MDQHNYPTSASTSWITDKNVCSSVVNDITPQDNPEVPMPDQGRAKEGVVLLIDVLGAAVRTIGEAIDLDEKFGKLVTGVNKHRCQSDPNDVRPPSPPLVFQDTMIFVWEDPKGEGERIYNLLGSIGKWSRTLIMLGLQERLPLRGAMSAGWFVLNEKRILGPAITDARDWYEEADWIGVVATPTLGMKLCLYEEKYRQANDDRCSIFPYFTRHEVPLKGGRKKPMWALSWPRAYIEKHKDRKLLPRLHFLSDMAEFQIPRSASSKYKNTVDFFDAYSRQYNKKQKEKERPNAT